MNAMDAAIRSFIEALVAGIEYQQQLVQRARRRLPPPQILDMLAMTWGSAHGFVDAWTVLAADDDGWLVRLRHACGAWCVAFVPSSVFDDEPRIEAAADAFLDIVEQQAGCYCVRPCEPCVAQRCAP